MLFTGTTGLYPVDSVLTLIWWIMVYLVDSTIHCLNNWDMIAKLLL